MIAACGCVNEIHEPTGAMRCARKCPIHRRAARPPWALDEAYYRELGVLGETLHLPELLEALGPFPAGIGDRQALEIGCGASPYAGAIRAAGWKYMGIDASPWAAWWTSRHWGVATQVANWDTWAPPQRYGLILAAHVLEHLDDAPAAIAKIAGSLTDGGEAWILVPDDSDPVNPDHLWFFGEHSLRATLGLAGLFVFRFRTFRRVKHENFLYCRAIKR